MSLLQPSQDDPLMADLRKRARSLIANNAVDLQDAPVQEPSGAPPAPDATSTTDDAPFEVALGPGARMSLRAAMKLQGADKRLDATLRQITGGQFSPDQLHELEDQALKNVEWDDGKKLTTLQPGVPVIVSPLQKPVIDKLMAQGATDQLGRAAQQAYQGALKNGQIRVNGR